MARSERPRDEAALRGYGIRCESAGSATLVEQNERFAAEVLDLQERLDRAEAKLKRTKPAAMSGATTR